MIELYTHEIFLPKDRKFVELNDLYFDGTINIGKITPEQKRIMYEIDKAIIVDSKTGLIKTPFGLASIKQLSTGCKTFLNIIREEDEKTVFSLDGCSYNIIEMILDYIEDKHNIAVYTTNSEIGYCKDREMLLDGKLMYTDIDIISDYITLSLDSKLRRINSNG